MFYISKCTRTSWTAYKINYSLVAKLNNLSPVGSPSAAFLDERVESRLVKGSSGTRAKHIIETVAWILLQDRKTSLLRIVEIRPPEAIS
jgi:hypothetical protein